MVNLSLNELKQIAKMRRIKNYKIMSKERLLSALDESNESSGNVNNFNNARIKKIREDFNELRHRFSKSKINEFKRSLYNIKNQENLSALEIKETKKSLDKLKKSLLSLKKYHYYDDAEYKGIRDIRNLFGEIDEDYYKPIKTKSVFNGNRIEYESRGDKNLSIKKYLDMIRPYLHDMINDHKTPMRSRVHSRDKEIDYGTQFGGWKIQLTIQINFISSKDSAETCTMYTKSDNVEIMLGSKTDDIITECFDSLLQKYQKKLEETLRGSEFIPDSVDLLYYHLQKNKFKNRRIIHKVS